MASPVKSVLVEESKNQVCFGDHTNDSAQLGSFVQCKLPEQIYVHLFTELFLKDLFSYIKMNCCYSESDILEY